MFWWYYACSLNSCKMFQAGICFNSRQNYHPPNGQGLHEFCLPSKIPAHHWIVAVCSSASSDWREQQTSLLVYSLAGQRHLEARGFFWTRTSQSITATIAWRKEEWRKEVADVPPSKVGNDLFSAGQTLVLVWGQPQDHCWEMGQNMYGPFWVLWYFIEKKPETRKLLPS